MIDDLAKLVRFLVAQVMGMPGKNVRPANQRVGAGQQTLERATVQITPMRDLGWGANIQTDGTAGNADEAIETLKQFTASVNFYGQPLADASGLAKASNASFDRAARLGARLQLTSSVALMTSLGLGFICVSQARDLTAVNDANYESRGQVDVTFTVVTQEVAAIATIVSAELDFDYQDPAGNHQTRTIEVP